MRVEELFHENRVRDALDREIKDLTRFLAGKPEIEDVRSFFRASLLRLGSASHKQEASLHAGLERQGISHWHKGRYRRAIHELVKTFPVQGAEEFSQLWELEYIVWSLHHAPEFAPAREKTSLLAAQTRAILDASVEQALMLLEQDVERQDAGVLEIGKVALTLAECYQEAIPELVDDVTSVLETQYRQDPEFAELLALFGVPLSSCRTLFLLEYLEPLVPSLTELGADLTTGIRAIVERHHLTLEIPSLELSANPDLFSRN